MMRNTNAVGWWLLFGVSIGATMGSSQQVSPVEAREVVDSLQSAVRDRYVLEHRVKSVNARLQALATAIPESGYSGRPALVEALTEELRGIDKHFAVFHPSIPINPAALRAQPEGCWAHTEKINSATALLRVKARLAHPPKATNCALPGIRKAQRVVLDLRECTGGSRASLQRVMSWFFVEGVHYASHQERGQPAAIMRTVPNTPRGQLADAELAVLVSQTTGSACEGLAYYLKQHERATIIAERTFGAAHAVRDFDLAHGFRVLMPISRPISPVSGSNWEGIGVEPDVACDAAAALDAALDLWTD